MAIVSGIDRGAVLWKYIKYQRVQRWNAETQKHEPSEIPRYFVVELYSRRARTNGARLPRHVAPFLARLKIRTEEQEYWNGHAYEMMCLAVGTRERQVFNKQQWEELPIHEVALRWYSKIKNSQLTPILDRRSEFGSNDIIEEMKKEAVDFEQETEWPNEPYLPTYNMGVTGNGNW